MDTVNIETENGTRFTLSTSDQATNILLSATQQGMSLILFTELPPTAPQEVADFLELALRRINALHTKVRES